MKSQDILNIFVDINECLERKHGCTLHSTCNNTDGGYDCVCDSGYRAKGPDCVGKLSMIVVSYFIK